MMKPTTRPVLNQRVETTGGLVIGNDMSRLVNITSLETGHGYRLDYTLISMDFYADPDFVFDEKFIEETRNCHNSERDKHNASRLLQSGLKELYGDQLDNLAFSDTEARAGLMFTFESVAIEGHDLLVPQLVSLTPVQATIEKHISFKQANLSVHGNKQGSAFDHFCAMAAKQITNSRAVDFNAAHDDMAQIETDPRLADFQSFFTSHNIKRGRAGGTFSFGSMMGGIDRLAHEAGHNVIFDHKIEALNRIVKSLDNRKEFERRTDFVNTATAISRNIGRNCQTFFGITEKGAASINTPALSHFCKTGSGIFTAQQTRQISNIHHNETVMGIRPSYMS